MTTVLSTTEGAALHCLHVCTDLALQVRHALMQSGSLSICTNIAVTDHSS